MEQRILSAKTVGGYDIIGYIIKEDDFSMVIEKALFYELVQTEQGNGKIDVKFYPATLLDKEMERGEKGPTITLQKSSIIFSHDIRSEIEAKYKQVASNIILARSL